MIDLTANASAAVTVAPVTATNAIPPTQIAQMQSPFGTLFNSISQVQLFGIVFGLVFLVWVLYTTIVLYHWFRYSRKSRLTIPVVVVHLVVSGFLFLMASSAFLSSL